QMFGLLALAWAWLCATAFRAEASVLVDDTSRVQLRWAAALFTALQKLFRLSVHIEGSEALTHGPMVLLVRHASIIDTLLPTLFIARPHGYRLRFVLKEELLEDPCIDVAGLRLPNHFVRRGGERTTAELDAIHALARGLGPAEGVLLYPEGTRFSRHKQRAAITHIGRDQPELAPLASRLRRVLPPKIAGTSAALDGAPDADLVILAHSGLEGFSTVQDIWSGALLGKTIRLRLWRIPRHEVPAEKERRTALLYEQWYRVDEFVTHHLEENLSP
ncbi:MAG: 1-acyl-sn-glycerol-3-phosphate acyltransferase, partial [Myxococcota bacterium]